jgi:protein-tyrosine phosphatase
MFREVTLQNNLPGRLYLHSMPGRYEAWSDFTAEAERRGIDLIVSLVSEDEIVRKSWSYADAIKSGSLRCPRECFPVPDYGVPENREAFAAFVTRIAKSLRSGHTILVHCGAGIGRTGTFAICLLLASGVSCIDAKRAVSDAGSYPETSEQKELVDWCEKRFQCG